MGDLLDPDPDPGLKGKKKKQYKYIGNTFSILAMIFLQNFSCFSFYPLEAKGGTLWSVYAMLWLVLSWLLPNGGGPGLLLMYPPCCGWCSVGCYLMVADLDCSSSGHSSQQYSPLSVS